MPCNPSNQATNANDQVFGPIPTGGVTIQHLYAMSGASTSAIIEVIDNTSGTALQCTITAGTSCTDDVHSISVRAGHFLEVEVAVANTPQGADTPYVVTFDY